MTAALRSGSDFPVPGLSGAPSGIGDSSPLGRRRESRTGPRSASVVTDPIDRSVTGRSPSSVTSAAGAGFPPPAPGRHCRVKGCGRRIVRGRLGFLEFVHAERVPFPHYARP